jgi:hypothetical protein
VRRTWLNGVNPVVNPALTATGELTFENAAIAAGVADAPASYTLQWFKFDNVADARENVDAPTTVTTARGQAPASLMSPGAGEYIGVVITAKHPSHAAWAKPATFHFRRAASGWTWVGAERE